MNRAQTSVGLDVGSSNIRAVILQQFEGEEKPRVMGMGIAPASGMRRGVVADVDEVVASIQNCVKMADRTSGITITQGVVSIGGSHVTYMESQGVVAIGKADGEITADDVARSLTAAETISLPANTEIIDIIPRSFNIDDQKNIKDPIGMNGIRLEVNALLILGTSSAIKNLTRCVFSAGVEITDLIFAGLAAEKAILTKRQKELGVVLVDIGGGTTNFIVYEEGEIVQIGVVPVGGSHVSNDLALGLRTSIDVAEKVKINYGSALPSEISKKDHINLSEIDSNEEGQVSRHHVAEIIEARTEEMFTMIDKELRKTGRSGMLPAGAVIVGDGAKLPGIIDVAKKTLRLPAQTGFPKELGGIVDKVDDPGYATAIGLALWGLETDGGTKSSSKSGSRDNTKLNDTVGKVKDWVKKFLP